MPPQRILIIGGSTRAAADSVRRAGWIPICADLFADYDLQLTAETIPVKDYPHSLPDDVARVRADGWMYCGALENHPEILKAIRTQCRFLGPLLGTTPEALCRVRDPLWWTSVLRDAGLPFLEVADQFRPPSPNGSWLQKPLASAGGRLIRVWDSNAATTPHPEPHYFQRRADGSNLSALFHCRDDQSAVWLGATCGVTNPHFSDPPSPFAYCGSYGPVANLSEGVLTTMRQTIETLSVSSPGLRGLVGLDFILEKDRIWLVEINPRYTASVEVLELATGRSFLNPEFPPSKSPVHRGSFATPLMTTDVDEHQASSVWPIVSPQSGIVAKQVLYTSRTIAAPDLRPHCRAQDPWLLPTIADIPQVPSRIEAGWPICTVLSSGPDLASVQASLKSRSLLVQTAIRETSTGS